MALVGTRVAVAGADPAKRSGDADAPVDETPPTPQVDARAGFGEGELTTAPPDGYKDTPVERDRAQLQLAVSEIREKVGDRIGVISGLPGGSGVEVPVADLTAEEAEWIEALPQEDSSLKWEGGATLAATDTSVTQADLNSLSNSISERLTSEGLPSTTVVDLLAKQVIVGAKDLSG